MSSDKALRLLALAQEIASADASFHSVLGPGAGDRRTQVFMWQLRERAASTFGSDYAERKVCGETSLAVDFYFPDEETIVEVALSLPNPGSEFEKDVLKAIMAQEFGNSVRRLFFISRPGAAKKCAQPGRTAVKQWRSQSTGCGSKYMSWMGSHAFGSDGPAFAPRRLNAHARATQPVDAPAPLQRASPAFAGRRSLALGVHVGYRLSPRAEFMSTHISSRLPDEQSWRFDDILVAEPNRVPLLEATGSPNAILEALRIGFRSALAADNVRWGREQACDRPEDVRAVVQFLVTPVLFDRFFNARTGYRAHFRAHYECGLRFNIEILEMLRLSFGTALAGRVVGRQLTCAFEDAGEARIDKAFLMASLRADLSKVWMCTKLIGRDGGIHVLPPGLSGPRLLLDEDVAWPAPYRDENDTWLDVKGAFLGSSGLYQPKDPTARAKVLQIKGAT